MKIDCTKINRATKVLKHIKTLAKTAKGLPEHAFLGAYMNGREHGYVLNTYNATFTKHIWFAWSEYRSSDSIVVYFDEDPFFGGISDKSYQNAHHFNDKKNKTAELLAAEYIIETIKKAIKEKKKA